MYVVDKPLKLREVMTKPVSVSISTMFQISYTVDLLKNNIK